MFSSAIYGLYPFLKMTFCYWLTEENVPNKDYLELAKQAAANEREYEWGLACEFWLAAATKAPENSSNKHWALLRSDFCRGRTRENGFYFPSEPSTQIRESKIAMSSLSSFRGTVFS
ncbi:hypothetical protein M445_13575 [Vibrio owensii 47666-1]|nr:hypothetical protein M445_13575 [Vibrio owensii 47666-1]